MNKNNYENERYMDRNTSISFHLTVPTLEKSPYKTLDLYKSMRES